MGLFLILINFNVFGPNLGTRNAKNTFGPFKVPKCNQKTDKPPKKFMSFKWLLWVLRLGLTSQIENPLSCRRV